MPDIRHDLLIHAPPDEVFRGVSTAEGLDRWWTLGAAGEPEAGRTWELDFGPGYRWEARVVRCDPGAAFELEMTGADDDWTGTRVGFELSGEGADGTTRLRFHHSGWSRTGEHFRTSSFCWAMYLRLLKRAVERGEVVPYPDRLEA